MICLTVRCRHDARGREEEGLKGRVTVRKVG